ncbi:MAG: DUF1254 domain-containing protein [Pseudomonadota bacterium]
MGKALFAGVFLVSAVLAHLATVHAVPGVIMSRAMAVMEARGAPLHSFALVPQTTPESQTVVRPSPDLVYSVCRFDLSKTERVLNIVVGEFDGLSSVSFFDARTNNFATRAVPEGVRLQLRLSRAAPDAQTASEIEVVQAPSDVGLVLIRRLAPTAAQFAEVEAASRFDMCGPVTQTEAVQISGDGE